jgi:hypothetical protein
VGGGELVEDVEVAGEAAQHVGEPATPASSRNSGSSIASSRDSAPRRCASSRASAIRSARFSRVRSPPENVS